MDLCSFGVRVNHINRIQSHTHSAAQVKALPHPTRSVRWINATLLIAALVLLMYYVVQVNVLAAQAWNMRQASDRLAVLHDEHDMLVAKESSLDDRQALTALARHEGLVPTDTVAYLVQDQSVAAAR